MSSWKLTKKLKETSFLRGHGSSSRRHSNASTIASDQEQAPPTPQSDANPLGSGSNGDSGPLRNASSRDTLISDAGSPTATPTVQSPTVHSPSQQSRTNTLTEQQMRGTVTQGDQQHHQQQHHQHHQHHQHTTEKSSLHSQTQANPKLLRVTIYELKNLVVDQYKQCLPGWAFDPTSTKPPPVYLVLDYDKTQILLYAIGGTVQDPVWDKTTSFDLSQNASEPLTLSLYLRTKQLVVNHNKPDVVDAAAGGGVNGTAGANSIDGAPRAGAGKETAQKQDVQLKDIMLGSVQVPPASFNSKETLPLARALLMMKCELHNTKNQPLSIEDFTLLKVVGKGSFGKVMQVRKNDTRQIYALKTIRKAHIVSKAEVGHTLAERTVLAKINNPFIVPLKFSFQSPEKLYLVLAFVNGGELFHHLQREGRFDLNRARFYTAELLCALECLHEYNVIYRDLKPENILLDYTGHIALCDFGLCKLNMGSKDHTSTFCGTPEYLAPELLLGQGYTKSVDWWTLGVLFYEMLTGLPPFYDQNINTMYHKIVKDPLTFPPDMDREAKSLIMGLLDRDPARRLGTNGASEIKAHPFFHQIDWKFLLNKKYAAPFLPSVASAVDTSNFDSEFTSEVPMDSVVDKEFFLSESVQQQFGGWSYSNESKLAGSAGRW